MASVVAGRPTMPDLFPLPKIACKLTYGYYIWQCDYELRRNHEIPMMNKALDKDTPVSYHFISSTVKVYSLTGEWAGRGEGNWRLHKLVSSLPHLPQKTQTTKKMRVKKRDGRIHKCLLASNFSNLIFCPVIALSTFPGGKWSRQVEKLIDILMKWRK